MLEILWNLSKSENSCNYFGKIFLFEAVHVDILSLKELETGKPGLTGVEDYS